MSISRTRARPGGLVGGRMTNRVTGVDVARALALLGMMATHIVPLHAAGADGGMEPTWVADWFAGRASALFAVLAGVGLALYTGGSSPSAARLGGARRAVAVRALLIAGIGLACGMLDTNVAVILVHYGLLFLAAVPFLGARPRTLLLWAAGWLVLSPVALYVATWWASSSGVLPLFTMHDGGAAPTFTDLAAPAPLIGNLLLTGYYPVLVWMAFLLVGLWAGRLRLMHPPVALAVAVGGAAVAFAAKLLSGWLLTGSALGPAAPRPGVAELAAALGLRGGDTASLDLALRTGYFFDAVELTPWWFAVAAPHSSAPLDVLHVAGAALAVLGACQLVCLALSALLSRFGDALLSPLTGAGSATLTLYVGHLVALDAASDVIAGADPLTVYLWFAVGALVIGAALKLFGVRGPLEAAIHAATSRLR